MKTILNKYQLSITLMIFGLLYASISFVNNYLFRTYAFDLGLFNNALYDYARFQNNEITLALPNIRPSFLGDHFSLYVILFSPLSWILGSYTMLVVQIFSILAGGIGIYRLFKFQTNNNGIATAALVHFFSMWGIFSALAFDYHDNVVAAMLVPWLFLYVSKEKYLKAALFIALILIAKENMAFWATFICLGLAIQYRKRTSIRNFLIIAMVVSMLYFLLVIKIIIPFINGGNGGYLHFSFSALGSNFGEAIVSVFTKPLLVLELLFRNTTNDPVLNGIKAELWIVVLFSGGFALIRKPYYLIMLLPIFAQKLFNDDPLKWGINYHYSIEYAPILCVAAFSLLKKQDNKKIQIFAYIFALLSITTTIRVMDSRKSIWYGGPLVRFYDKSHYMNEFNVSKVYKGLKNVDKNATISSQSILVPHLALRDRIYNFPFIGDAQYIVLIPKAFNKWPMNEETYKIQLDSIYKNSSWQEIYNDEVLIFKRN